MTLILYRKNYLTNLAITDDKQLIAGTLREPTSTILSLITSNALLIVQPVTAC